jgi:methyltransferase (TIGR00027 family)
MKENQASFTAMSVAYMRAYHSRYDAPKIFDDFLAYDLIPEEKRELIEKHLIKQYVTWDQQLNDTENATSLHDRITTSESLMQAINNVISRARYTEDTLEEAFRQGVKQYVILGAGMDTFAFRRPEMLEELEVFEIDHPSTQKFKLHRLAELGWKHPAKLHFIPIDFTKESLVTALTRSSSYDPTIKTFFSWFGVTPYLPQKDVLATLRFIADVAPVSSSLVFDYIDTDAFIPEKLSPQMRELLEYLSKIGEPLESNGFNPSNLAEELASLGFRLYEDLSPTNIEGRYLQGRTYGHYEHGHFACAVVE